MIKTVLPILLAAMMLGVIQNAYAIWPFPDEPVIEHGLDFDQYQIAPNTFTWTSHPTRLKVGEQYIDYRTQDEPTYFTFESASGSVTISKSTCSIKMLDAGFVYSGEDPLINSISQIVKEAQNGTDTWSYHEVNDKTCNFSYTKNGNGVQVILEKNDMDFFGNGVSFQTIYDISYAGKIKTTYKYLNNDQSKPDHKYGFTQVFNGSFDVVIGDDHYSTNTEQSITITKEQMRDKLIAISKNGFTILYDPQNYIHDYLWAVKIEHGKMIFDFTYSKGRLGVGDTLEIDPTFTGNGANNKRIQTTSTNDAGKCSTVFGTNSSSFFAYQPVTGTNDVCQYAVTEFNISSLAGKQLTVVSGYVELDVSVVDNSKPCQVKRITTDLSTITQIDLNDIQNSNKYALVNSDSDCGSVGVDKRLDFGPSGLGDIYGAVLNGTAKYAVGIGCPQLPDRPATTRCNFEFANPSLSFTYSPGVVRYENKPFMSDGSTVIGSGSELRRNSTDTSIKNLNSTGYATWTDTVNSASYNYTIKDALDNFVDNRTNNKILSASQSQTGNTQIKMVDCSPGVDTDHQLKLNFTNYHIMSLTSPVCNDDGDISTTAQFLKQGLGPSTNQTTKLIDRVIDTTDYPWLPGKLTVNGTAKTGTYLSGVVNFTNIQVGNGYLTSVLKIILYTDNVTSSPQNLRVNSISSNSVKLFWTPPASNHGAYPYSYAVYRGGTLIQNSTGNVLTYTDTGLSPGTTYSYAVCAWNRIGCSPTTTGSNMTFTTTTGTITLVKGNVGDTINVNATLAITGGAPSPFTVSDIFLYRNNSLVYTNSTDFTISSVGGHYVSRIWYQITNNALNIFHVRATVSNSTGTITLSSSNTNVTREYAPVYAPAVDNPAVEGFVNYTVDRFDGEDSILLKVNRQGGSLGTTWTINCITQTNTEAQATKNQSQNWPGTWNNRSGTGYFNGTWDGFRNTPGYITCINPPGILFTTTSFTNSSLALFGIQIFDASYGSMLGVPVGIFFLALAGGMANKRTAPTWIVVLLGMAGVMATIGFFTLTPIIWGLALVTGLLGLLVNQKVF